jgi:DNA ligase-1
MSSFQEVPGEFFFAKGKETDLVEDIESFLDESITEKCEGLMVKTLEGSESSYEPSKRSRNWLKVKKDYLEGVGDSLDLVVIGGYIGKGKRTGVYGGFLLACYDSSSESYQSICKVHCQIPTFIRSSWNHRFLIIYEQIGTGFSEEHLTQLSESLKNHIITVPKSYYILGDAKADVWFDPVQVWEVKAADLSLSPVYKAGVGLVRSHFASFCSLNLSGKLYFDHCPL